MSVRMIQLFKGIQASPTQRLVAYMLADAHNEHTERCDPSIASLIEFTSLSNRAVTNAIKDLEKGGHITAERANGRRPKYRLHPRTRCTPAPDAPPQEVRGYPAGGAGGPPHDVPQTPAGGAGVPPHDVPQTPAGGAGEPERTGILTGKEPKRVALTRSVNGPEFPEDLPSEYRMPLTQWWDYKKEKHQAYKPTGWKVLVNQQRRKPLKDLIRDLEHSMAGNYAGIFPPKEQPVNGHHKPKHAAYSPESATAGKTPEQILNL